MSDAPAHEPSQPEPILPEPLDLIPWRRMMAQAAALAVQDATANLRAVNTIAAASMGAAQQLLARGQSNEDALQMLSLAEKSVRLAQENFTAVSGMAQNLMGACENGPGKQSQP